MSRQAVHESSQGQHGAEKRDTDKKDRDKSKWMKLKTEVLALEKEAATMQEGDRV